MLAHKFSSLILRYPIEGNGTALNIKFCHFLFAFFSVLFYTELFVMLTNVVSWYFHISEFLSVLSCFVLRLYSVGQEFIFLFWICTTLYQQSMSPCVEFILIIRVQTLDVLL